MASLKEIEARDPLWFCLASLCAGGIGSLWNHKSGTPILSGIETERVKPEKFKCQYDPS